MSISTTFKMGYPAFSHASEKWQMQRVLQWRRWSIFAPSLELETKFLECYFDANLESEPGDILPELTSSA
jgi:hypothetical protein